MPSTGTIIIFGASARAAAFSAIRAGLRPWCADLFADEDLQARCPVQRILFHDYPNGFATISDQGPLGPWMYTGGLENHSALVERISEKRFLWGNPSLSLKLARSPTFLAEIFRSNGLNFPATFLSSKTLSRDGRWLRKPFQGAGGTGIQFADSHNVTRLKSKSYFQQFIEGTPCSAIYAGSKNDARLLGVSRQLVGETWLHAAPFHYCGNIGPLNPAPAIENDLKKIGSVLNRHCHLRGLFGVDFILADGVPWPVEVNPRYPASVEVLEYSLGINAMAWHQAAFVSNATALTFNSSARGVVGKAILFAKLPLKFSIEGPWNRSLSNPRPIKEMPEFVDIPTSGQAIETNRPILTFFSRSTSVEACINNLQQIAHVLDQRLWKT